MKKCIALITLVIMAFTYVTVSAADSQAVDNGVLLRANVTFTEAEYKADKFVVAANPDCSSYNYPAPVFIEGGGAKFTVGENERFPNITLNNDGWFNGVDQNTYKEVCYYEATVNVAEARATDQYRIYLTKADNSTIKANFVISKTSVKWFRSYYTTATYKIAEASLDENLQDKDIRVGIAINPNDNGGTVYAYLNGKLIGKQTNTGYYGTVAVGKPYFKDGGYISTSPGESVVFKSFKVYSWSGGAIPAELPLAVSDTTFSKATVAEAMEDGGKVSASVDVTNSNYPCYTEQSATLIVASYSSDGSLMDIALTPANVKCGTKETISGTVDVGEGCTVKSFVWNNLSAIVPIVDSKSWPQN